MASERTRYYQEAREGIYNGTVFVTSNLLANLPLSLLTTLTGALVIFKGLKNELLCTENPTSGTRSCRSFASYSANELETIERESITRWSEYNWYPDFVIYWLTIWACYIFAEQQVHKLFTVFTENI